MARSALDARRIFSRQSVFPHGRALQGLQQTAILARLSPGGRRSRGAVHRRLRAGPRELAADACAVPFAELAGGRRPPRPRAAIARNTDAILALADAHHRRPDSAWLPVLLSSLIASGDYARARAIWSSIGGGQRPATACSIAASRSPARRRRSTGPSLRRRWPRGKAAGRSTARDLLRQCGRGARGPAPAASGRCLPGGDAVGRARGPSRSAALVDPLRQGRTSRWRASQVDEAASSGWTSRFRRMPGPMARAFGALGRRRPAVGRDDHGLQPRVRRTNA